MRVLWPLAVVALLGVSIVPGRAIPQGIVVTDGDTVHQYGRSVRIVDMDAPEIRRAKCEAERALGQKCADRLRALLAERGGRLIVTGGQCGFGRACGRLMLGWPSNGEEAWATIAIREGCAVPCSGRCKHPDWCKR